MPGHELKNAFGGYGEAVIFYDSSSGLWSTWISGGF